MASYTTSVYPDPRVHVHNFHEPFIGYRNIIGQALILKRAAGIVRSIQPDIVHSPEYTSTAAFLLFGVRTPLVVTVPGNIFYRLSMPDGSGYEWYYAQVLKWAARRSARGCARVIAISNEMKYWWEKTGSAPDATPMIPLGVDPDRFRAVANARMDLRLDENATILVYIGRFSREKGLLDLLDAAARVPWGEGRRPLKIVLIGRGPLAPDLLSAVARLSLEDVVEVRDWVDSSELSAWYSAADAVVLPSYTEGLSRTILESMSCGTPVIASAISGSEDHVQNGVTGYLFPSHDVDALASVIQKVSDDPMLLRSMRDRVFSYTQENLTWSRVVARVVDEVYRPILGQ